MSKSSKDGRDRRARAKTGPGAHSLAEILSQSECWAASLESLRQKNNLENVRRLLGTSGLFVIVGCGSSYYVALCAAATMSALGRTAHAVPASELLLYPEIVLPDDDAIVVLISRSGQTSEVLKAAELLKLRGIRSLAISCAAGQALEKLATQTIVLPADEQSTVMTRSFSSMLLAMQYVAADIAGDESYRKALLALPRLAAKALKSLPDQIREFVAAHEFADYVCLGHGPSYGLACEYALKTTEMSVSYAQSFHSLEFRHGPKSIVGPETLLIFLMSDAAYQAERDLLLEMKALGGTTLVVTNRADQTVRDAADLLLELQIELPELARLAPSVVPGQLLGLYTGLNKGLDPDTPRNLARSVILEDQHSRRSEHAAL